MARLDKTFPTNDCSMCILSPKLVEAARHRNIDLLTLGEVKNVSGHAGDFSVRVTEKARYVDIEKCTGCGLCLENCPTRNMPRFDVEKKPVLISAEHKSLVEELLGEHGREERAVIRVMQEINARLTYLPRDVLAYLSEATNVPLSRLYRIGSFYKAFSFERRGRHTISVCDGTACHIRGAPKLIAELKRELSVNIGQTTTDGRFYLEIVRCLGCCSLAPVMRVDERIYGGVKPTNIAKILKDYPL
jgi:NADH:ubiquinone oxidoreductase subunit E